MCKTMLRCHWAKVKNMKEIKHEVVRKCCDYLAPGVVFSFWVCATHRNHSKTRNRFCFQGPEPGTMRNPTRKIVGFCLSRLSIDATQAKLDGINTWDGWAGSQHNQSKPLEPKAIDFPRHSACEDRQLSSFDRLFGACLKSA